MVCQGLIVIFLLELKLLLFYIIQYSSLILQYMNKILPLIKKYQKQIHPQYKMPKNSHIIQLSDYNFLVLKKYKNFSENKSIILMSNQNNQEEECFVATQIEYRAAQSIDQNNDVDEYIRYSLPQANQLKPHYRPSSMIARVMSTQPQIYTLPSVLNQPCEQQVLTTINTNSKPKLSNKQKLSLVEYLSKKQFSLIYNKYGINVNSKKTISQMTIRLRTISQLSDYDWKIFKEISDQQYRGVTIQDKIDSNFQCGNLGLAYNNFQNQAAYYLLLQQDTNTHGYTNWFFYRFRNVNRGIRKFYILNLVKRTSFYKQGMKISIFSMKKYQQSQNKLKWHKAGNNISFFQTNFDRDQHNDCFNCLYFQYDFQYDEDQVYFSVCQPYTYTRMANLIKNLSINQTNKLNQNVSWKINPLGYSISNNILPCITFYGNNCTHKKRTILIMGRQHPSQTAGSFISESLIRMLSQQTNQYISFLLNKFNIVIIPMVNPDGVIYGNSRSNLAGLDLNRHWGVDIIKQLTPQTHKIRSELCNLQNNNNHIKFLLDLHGHGKKLNTFLFCCKKQDRISNRYFPLILSKFEERFDLVSCTYGISKDKENTIRAQLYDIGIRDCYTLQNSYYGYNKKNSGQIISYAESDYSQIALNIIKSLYLFFSTEKSQKQLAKQKFGINIDTINEELMKIVDKLQKEQKNMVVDDDIMSESDPEGDGLKLQERLKMCNNSKTLDKKIRQTYRKAKSSQKNKSPKKNKVNQKKERNEKIRTQPADQEKDSQGQDIKNLQKKIQGKLILSKKLRTQNKIRTSTRQRKSMLETKRPNQEEQIKLTKTIINKSSFNPLKIPSQQPSNKTSNSFQGQKSNEKTKAYERCRIYQKLKTEISQNFSFSMIDIKKQGDRKQQIEQKLIKLKQQNLKNVVKQSLLFMNTTFKNKKCKFIEDKKMKSRMSNHIIDARFHSFSVQIQDPNSKTEQLKVQMSESNLQKNKKILKSSYESANYSKIQSPQKRKRPKKSYQRFQAFVKNSPALNKLTTDGKGPVFYHFPMM